MSLKRFIFYGAVIGGWSAFVGWLLCEIFLNQRGDVKLIWTGAFVGGSICAGLVSVAALVNFRWATLLPRAGIGFALGFVGGLLSALLGNGLLALIGPTIVGFTLGWAALGIGVGSVVGIADGLFDSNWKKIRNGVIGGCVGGFLGGFLFIPIHSMIGSAMSSRATAFVILGLCVGLFIGLAQVLLREAWLTVERGFRPGRQLILSLAETTLGTSEKGQMIFIAFGAKGVEPIHLMIIRHDDGGYYLHDNNSRTGTLLNEQRIAQPVRLKNNDIIGLGMNRVRYQERMKQTSSAPPQAVAAKPVPAQAASQAVRAATPQAAVPVAARPVQQPAPPPSQSSPAPVAAPCPICGQSKTGVPGKRFCDSCRIHF